MGTLYLVATPIGNMRDITPSRARCVARGARSSPPRTRARRASCSRTSRSRRDSRATTITTRRAKTPRLLRRWTTASRAGQRRGHAGDQRSRASARRRGDRCRPRRRAGARGVRRGRGRRGERSGLAAVPLPGLPAAPVRRPRRRALRRCSALRRHACRVRVAASRAGDARGRARRARRPAHRRLPRTDEAPRGDLARHGVGRDRAIRCAARRVHARHRRRRRLPATGPDICDLAIRSSDRGAAGARRDVRRMGVATISDARASRVGRRTRRGTRRRAGR